MKPHLLVRTLLLTMVCCWCHAAQAQAPLTLEAPTGVRSLQGHLQALRDPSHALSAQDAAGATGWQPVQGTPAFGFTADAVWLRFSVERPAGLPASWRLEIANPLIEDVRVARQMPSGAWQQERAGLAVPRAQWPLNTRAPTFAVELRPGLNQFLVRLQTRTSMTTAVRVWEPEAFYARAANQSMAWGVYAGIYLLVILMQALAWLWTRERISAWYVAYAGLHLLAILITAGYLQKALAVPPPWALNLLGIGICAVVIVSARYATIFLELKLAMPRTTRAILAVCTGVSGVTCALVLAGYYHVGVPVAQMASIVLLVVHTALAVVLARRGHAPARHFLYLFGLFYLGALIRYSANLGLVPASFLTEYSIQVGAILHIVAMNIFLIYRFNLLRKSLELERSARQQQRDFVAMVSHEFRTPLAIINTTVQQMAADLSDSREKFQRRCANIKDAARRMADMMDTYLTAERLENSHQGIRMQPTDLRELIEQVAAQWPSPRLRLQLAHGGPWVQADPDLLKLALRNLVANADRHAPAGEAVEVRLYLAQAHWCITVANTGDGIPADELPRVFQKYFRGQASQRTPGAGLGLFIVRDIVEAHEGRVSVTSRPGETAFTIRLPVARLAEKPLPGRLP